jgi:hypothetical protein
VTKRIFRARCYAQQRLQLRHSSTTTTTGAAIATTTANRSFTAVPPPPLQQAQSAVGFSFSRLTLQQPQQQTQHSSGSAAALPALAWKRLVLSDKALYSLFVSLHTHHVTAILEHVTCFLAQIGEFSGGDCRLVLPVHVASSTSLMAAFQLSQYLFNPSDIPKLQSGGTGTGTTVAAGATGAAGVHNGVHSTPSNPDRVLPRASSVATVETGVAAPSLSSSARMHSSTSGSFFGGGAAPPPPAPVNVLHEIHFQEFCFALSLYVLFPLTSLHLRVCFLFLLF